MARLLRKLVFHHSASGPKLTPAQIVKMHVAKKWDGPGYHCIIDRTGRRYFGEHEPGRGLSQRGAHAGKKGNTNSVGVCLIGWNNHPKKKSWGWTNSQIVSAQEYLDAWRIIVPDMEFFGHRDFKATLCPGLEIRDILK